MRVVLSALIALLCLYAGGARAKSDAYKIAPPAQWVLPLSSLHPPSANPQPTRGGVAYLLRDYQTRIEAHGKTAYFHSATKALDGGGVEKVANVSIGFDPSYQSLTLHAINVIRAGVVIPKLDGARIHVLQRETELDYLIYDGSMTASVLLDDIRIGDIVEYAFSLSGSNPVFQNLAIGRAELEWAVPVEHSFVRLLAPAGRPLRIAPRNSKLQPQIRESDGYREYRWEQRDVPALKVDSGSPAWFDPYGSVQWAEFPDWAAVVAWALPLYRPASDPGVPLQQEIDRIRRENADPASRIAAVLKMVQRDVRYLGIEVGPGSHAPTAPVKVFQRRFGDCKDKTLLAVTMLNALGIEAVPALVNTGLAKEVASWGPAPTAFNHVLVRVRLDGVVYWLDPTRPLQQGDLAHLYQPDYGYALVLEQGGTGLSPMAQPFKGQKTVRAVFDSSAGVGQPVDYTVTTTVRGSGADSLRAQLASNKADMVTQYENFYARSYAEIRQRDELRVRDDTDRNALTVVESYRIPGFWERDKKNVRREANIEMSEIDEPLKAPEAIGRNAPLRLNYPYEITEIVEVLLPEPWGIKASSVKVNDPAFEFSYDVVRGAGSRSVIITGHYKALRDHVEPGDMGRYAARLKEARNVVGYRLFTGGTAGDFAGKSYASPGVVMLCLLAAWSWLGVCMWRAPAAHGEINRRLLLSVILVSASVGMLTLPALKLSSVLPALLVLLALVSQYLLRTAPQVPATHIAYKWAKRCYDARGGTPAVVLRSLARTALPLVGWAAIGGALAKLLG